MFRGRAHRLHFVGIGGIGMSGIAELLLNLGFDVRGSDLQLTTVTRRLEHLGATAPYVAGGIGGLALGALVPLLLPRSRRLG